MMLHMMAFSPTKARYMTLTKATKEDIWLKGLAIELGFELKIVAGIATGALSKVISSLRFQHRLNLLIIEFGDAYKAPPEETAKGPASESSAKKKGKTVVITTEDMQKRRNDVKAITTLLLALLDEHHRKSKVSTASVLTASTQVSTASTDVVKSRRRKERSYKQGPKEEEPAPKALMPIDGIGWDWSYMANEEENHALVADDEVSTEFALMAKSSSSSDNKVYDDSYCSKSCRKNTENLTTKISKLNEELRDCETDLYNYKRGVSQVEARLVEFKEHEVKICEKIRGLERDVEIRDNKIEYLNNEFEHTGFPEFVVDTVTDYRRPTPSIDASKCNKSELQSSNFSVCVHEESSVSIMSKPMIKFVKESNCPRVIKTNKTENARKSTVKYVAMYRNVSKGPKVRGNQHNWNNLKCQQLGKDFLMQNKAYFKCGYFDHLASNCGVWVKKGKTWTKDNYAHKSMTPRAVLLKPGTTPIVDMSPLDMEVERLLDRKSTTNGCQFLGRRLISWQCKKQTIVATSATEAKYVVAASGRRHLAFCDYHNMVAILEKTELNTDFHQIVDFLKASHIRHLKLNDEEGISSLHAAKLFDNLSLMSYNILPNQMFTFQKDKFSHQWKFLIHTIMQCLVQKSKALSPAIDEHASLSRDNRQGEAFLTVSSLDAGPDRENITKTSALSYESSPRVTSLDADEGSMQQRLHELMELCTSLQRQQSHMATKIKYQDLEISRLKARIKSLKDKERRSAKPTQEDAPIPGGIKDIGEELGVDKSIELGSNDTEEMVNVLTSMEAEK
nr:putative ribonuclease H-like domain-containing protein [Tanacetum cinerariifolium]